MANPRRRTKSLGLSHRQMREVARKLKPDMTDAEFNKFWGDMLSRRTATHQRNKDGQP